MLSLPFTSRTPTPTSPSFLFLSPRLPVRSPAVLRAQARPGAARAGREESSHPRPDFGTVDESMIVLRKRMHDMEVAERNYEPPSDWTEWEKRYYTRYGSDVCELAGMVQALLLNARPGVAVGLAALLAMSVPTSAALIWMRLLDAAAHLIGIYN